MCSLRLHSYHEGACCLIEQILELAWVGSSWVYIGQNRQALQLSRERNSVGRGEVPVFAYFSGSVERSSVEKSKDLEAVMLAVYPDNADRYLTCCCNSNGRQVAALEVCLTLTTRSRSSDMLGGMRNRVA